MMHLELMSSRFDAANNMADSALLSKYYIQKEVLKLSDSEIADLKLESEQEAQHEHFIEQLKMGEQPGAEAPMGGASEGAETEESKVEAKTKNDTRHDKNDTRQYTKDAMPYDPIGTREMPGYPKNYFFNEDGESQLEDKLNDPEDEEMKKTLDFIRKKNKNRRSKTDMFDRTIADIMKYDHVANDMMGNLIKDHEENKLEESTLSSLKSLKN